MTATTRYWREALLGTLCADACTGAVGAALTCEDAERFAYAAAGAGGTAAADRVWAGHLAACNAEHEPVRLERPVSVGVRDVDALLRAIQPAVLRVVVPPLTCDDVDLAATSAWLLDSRLMLAWDLLVAHAPACPGPQQAATHWDLARPVLDAAVERVRTRLDAP